MIFRPDAVTLILAGRKTQTRRRSLPGETACRYVPGRSYAVQPGRGQKAVARILVTGVTSEAVSAITEADAVAEGFPDTAAFGRRWIELHGPGASAWVCWRIEFRLDAVLPSV